MNLLIGARAALIALAVTSAPGPVSARPASDVQPAAAVSPLAPGERHATRVPLARGDYLAVDAESGDLLLRLRILRPDGSPIVDLAYASDAPKRTAIQAPAAGDYVVEIAAIEAAAAGTYRLAIANRSARPGDAFEVGGWASFNAAEAQRAQFERAATQRAIRDYEAAMKTWCRHLPCTAARARALVRIGDARLSLGESAAAWTAYEGALRAARERDDARMRATALTALFGAHLALGQIDAADRSATQALEASREAGDLAGEAAALNAIGDVQTLRGDTLGSLDTYARARDAAARSGSRRALAQSHLNLGFSHSDMRDGDAASAAYREALALWTAIGDREGEARTSNALGTLHAKRGERQEALADYRRARDLFQRMGHLQGLGVSLNGLGYVYSGLGDVDAALDHYQQQARVHHAADFKEGEGAALAHIGGCLLAKGRPAEALASLTSGLAFTGAVGDRKVEAFTHDLIGLAHAALGDDASALAAFERSRELSVSHGDRAEEAYALDGIGRIRQRAGRYDEARAALERARTLSRDTDDRAGESLALYHLALLDRDQGRTDDALSHVEASLAIAEALRADVASFDLRASFVASIRSRQETQIDLLMALHAERPGLGYERRAFDAAERARARSLLEALAESRETGAEPDAALRAREEALRQELRAKADRFARLGSTAAERTQAAAIERDIDRLRLEHDAVRGELRAGTPRKAASADPLPRTLSEVQTRILDGRAILLQYFVGEQRSYVWAVRTVSVEARVLPGRAALETLVRGIRQDLQPPAQAKAVEPSGGRQAALRELGDLLLAPLREPAARGALVLIAPDGPLQLAPFAALPVPAGGGATAPLLAAHEIVYVPSLSTVDVVRGAPSAVPAWTRSAAIFADPVFEPDDPRLDRRLRHRPSTDASAPEGATRTARLLRDAAGLAPGATIPRLLDSRGEARAIQSILPDARLALDFEASRDRAIAGDLAQYRVVHFATHALVDDERPELSGIVLSLYDAAGRRQDGILRLGDISGLSLRADLVVLSACSTAVGKQVAGEGLLNLGRGFMHAGSRRVLATLWNVDDEASGALMARFYARMFVDGLGPAAALRQAQLEIAAQPRWSHARYWAGFVLIGDWQDAVARPIAPAATVPDGPPRRERREDRVDTPGPRTKPSGRAPQTTLD